MVEIGDGNKWGARAAAVNQERKQTSEYIVRPAPGWINNNMSGSNSTEEGGHHIIQPDITSAETKAERGHARDRTVIAQHHG